MNDPAPQDALFYALCLILPLSALFARQLPIKQVAKMAIAWIAIFALALLLATQRHRVAAAWSSLHDAVIGTDRRVTGQAVRIPMADDGHFYADVSINGIRRRMLIDSGATTTAVSTATATAAGIAVDENGFPEVISTANGDIVALPGTAAHVTLGGIAARDLGVIVSPSFDGSELIGMNFLSQLQAWRVEGETLVLVPSGE